jgi:hypothetical protein
MIPAVPSPDGVADVFSVSNSGSVQAIAADGHVAWRAPLAGRLIPDFQGGYIDAARNSVQKRDGLTGQAHPAYVSSWSNSPVVVHTDGTVFQFDNYSLVAIDPLTGRPKFTVPMQIGTYGAWYQSLIIAGDGYAYALYGVDSGTGSTESKQTKDPASGEITYTETTSTWQYQTQYRVLRVGIDNSSRDIPLHTYTDSGYSKNTDTKVISRYDENGNPVYKHVYHREERETGSSFVDYEAAMITNADQGVLLSWRDISVPDYQYSHDWDSEGHELGKTETSGEATFPWRLTAISGGEITSDATINLAYDRDTPQPVLQKEDGTFLGYQEQDSNQLMAFDASGNIKWSFPTDPNGWAEPLYALADGGMIYRQYTDYRNGTYHTQKLITLDDKGNESKRETDEGLTLSWKGAYKPGSTKSVVKDMLRLVLSFGAAKNGNVTGNSTAVKHRSLRMFWCGSNICKASDGTGKDVTFSYSPVGSNKTPIDFSGLHPEWVGQIMAQALYSLKQAFARYPVSVFLGNDGNRALVTGDYPAAQSGSIPCADTFSGSHVSAVYYLVNMEEAQHASSLSPNFPPVTPEDLKYFGTLIRAIGTGIGNNTAHEFAHQLNIKGMDQHTDSDAYDFFSCVGYPDSTNGSPALYTGIGKDGKTLIHWGKIASEDLNKVLLK